MSRYISLDWLNAHTNYICERGRKDISRIIYADKLNDAPTIDIVKCGEWKPKNHHTDYCSECGFEETQWRTVDYNFCPKCGARMRGESDGSI